MQITDFTIIIIVIISSISQLWIPTFLHLPVLHTADFGGDLLFFGVVLFVLFA
jgi:hypothetical protein